MAQSYSDNIIEIDGSFMEGGGQILRIATAISAILIKPIRVINIRAGRKNPGLRPQHLTGIELVKNICNGVLKGAHIGSTEITFNPGKIQNGSFKAETGTAGSIVLLLQVALPCLLYADGPTELILKGGTNAEMAPQIDYTQMVFKSIAEKMGIKFDLEIIKRGYYPRGGGLIKAKIYPVENELKSLHLIEISSIKEVTGYSFVAGNLPIKVANSMADEAVNVLKTNFKNCSMKINRIKELPENAVGTATGIIVMAEMVNGCRLASSALGKRGVPAEQVGLTVGQELIEEINNQGCVDQHLQDQLIILMALASGISRVNCGRKDLQAHTLTAIHVVEKLIPKVKFKVFQENGNYFVECQGIAHSLSQHLNNKD